MTDKIYIGKSKTMQSNYGEFLSGSICVTDIPEAHVKVAKNGKKYLNITISKMKEPDKFGNDYTISVFVPKKMVETVKDINNESDVPF